VIDALIVGDEEVIKRLTGFPEKVRGNVHQSIGRLVLQLQKKVVSEKLSGQVLNVRTGRLRRSVDNTIVETPGAISGVVSTNVEYAPIHEYGFEGTVSVKAHLRQIKNASLVNAGKVAKGQVVNNRAGTGVASVRAHTRQINMPARSFLRSSLKEMTGEIREELNAAIARSTVM